eukprot:6227142-Prymnesium_polylepis.1
METADDGLAQAVALDELMACLATKPKAPRAERDQVDAALRFLEHDGACTYAQGRISDGRGNCSAQDDCSCSVQPVEHHRDRVGERKM